MLVVVEDRNIAEFFELLFDIEAIGRLDVLQVDASERARKQLYTFDELFRVLGVDRKVDCSMDHDFAVKSRRTPI